MKYRFGHVGLRPLQREALNAVLRGQDVFAIMPTASKSLCHQLPAVLWNSRFDGVSGQGSTLVISPLLALILEQVHGRRAKGIDSRMLYSDNDKDERTDTPQCIGSWQALQCLFRTRAPGEKETVVIGAG